MSHLHNWSEHDYIFGHVPSCYNTEKMVTFEVTFFMENECNQPGLTTGCVPLELAVKCQIQ